MVRETFLGALQEVRKTRAKWAIATTSTTEKGETNSEEKGRRPVIGAPNVPQEPEMIGLNGEHNIIRFCQSPLDWLAKLVRLRNTLSETYCHILP